MVSYPGTINVNTTVNGTLTVTGNGQFDSNLSTTNDLSVGNASTFVGTVTAQDGITVSAQDLVVSTGNLSVGGNALGVSQPADNNLLAWTYDPSMATTGALLTNGTVYLSALYPARSTNVTKLYFHIGTAGVTATAGQNFVGLYNSAGTLLQSAGVDANVTTTGLQTVTITSQAVTAGSMYWVAMVFNAATAPTIVRGTGVTGVGSLVNVGLTAASFRFATNGTGATALASTITPASNVTATFAGPWAAMS
jgi:hypothetical protein